MKDKITVYRIGRQVTNNIFTVCDALIINKIDVLPYFDFDMEKVVEYARMRNPKLEIFPISAKTGEGVDAWCEWLRGQVADWKRA